LTKRLRPRMPHTAPHRILHDRYGRRRTHLRARVVALHDVVEGALEARVNLVQQRVDEAQDGLAVREAPGIQVRHQAREHGRRGRGAVHGAGLAAELDVVVVADGGDVGGAAARGVEVTSGHGSRVLDVGGHDGVLPGGARSDVGEAAAGGEEGQHLVGGDDLVSVRRAGETARGADGGVDGAGLAVLQLRRADGGHERGGGGEVCMSAGDRVGECGEGTAS